MCNTNTFHECCNLVIRASLSPIKTGVNGYAVTYAKAGLRLTGREEQRVQCLYILSNLASWRGSEARLVKEELKKLSNR
jgi:hypothetical protein